MTRVRWKYEMSVYHTVTINANESINVTGDNRLWPKITNVAGVKSPELVKYLDCGVNKKENANDKYN